MSGIQQLPPEILQQIANEFENRDVLKSCRAVSRYLSAALDPLFFFEFEINLSRPAPRLEELATRNCKASQFARKLKIRSFCQERAPKQVFTLEKQPLPTEVYLESYLSLALCSFETVSSFLWRIYDPHPTWIRECVLQNLSCHSETLAKLEIILEESSVWRYNDDFSRLLRQLNRIHTCEIRGSSGYLGWNMVQDMTKVVLANLTHLGICGWELNDISSIVPHLRSLRSVKVNQISPPHFWVTLQKEGVFLREIRVQDVEETLLEYLQSYTGMESFTVSCPGEHLFHLDHRSLCEQFYEYVLPKHRPSLKVLHFGTNSEEAWCFNAEYARHLTKCKRLEEISFGIELWKVRGQAGNDVVDDLIRATDSLAQLRVLTIHVEETLSREGDLNAKIKIWYSIARAKRQNNNGYIVHIQMGRSPKLTYHSSNK